MKRILLFATALVLGANTMAQNADFELPLSGSDTAWFGQTTTNASGDTTFTNGYFTFENNYNSAWGSWSGWAYSNDTDVSTSGYTNQFGNITGSGESSTQFGVFFQSFTGKNRIFTNTPVNLSGAYFTNTTYAYFSMLNGDSFATQFGDTSNASGGADWFLLTIYALDSDTLHTGDSVNFYLADYRFTDNTQDYIINTWEWVDLSSLGTVSGLDFKLTSSDVGQFGMNTPAYFAMDNLTIDFANINDNNFSTQSIYPNPTTGILSVNTNENSTISIFNINGQLIRSVKTQNSTTTLDLSDLDNGIYFIQVENKGVITTQKVVKQ